MKQKFLVHIEHIEHTDMEIEAENEEEAKEKAIKISKENKDWWGCHEYNAEISC